MSLRIIVLAKQVPDTRNVGKDAMTAEGTVNRSALPAIFNPEDLNALEQALRLKDAHPGSTVTVLTMGPGRAAEIIREGLYRGADNGYLLTDRVDLTKQEISTVQAYIDRLQDQIDVKTTELEAAEVALEEKQDEFAQTVRTTYEQGEISYLEVLLNSSSFSDLLSRMEIITSLMDYNQKVVDEYTAAKEDIEQKRDDLQQTQDEQKDYEENLNYKVEDLAASEAEQAALQESIEAYKAESEAEYDRIAAEMQSVSDQIAELSRQSAANGSVPAGDGTLIWPTPSCTTNSSAYGWRIHPIYGTMKFHAGEDIPAGYGADILAAASGTVVTAGWVSGYGNYTVIDHGGGMMTAYGHQSQILVSVGQTVTQGQLIGKVGSTGNSTGPHLHFEVYINGETVDPKSFF